MNIKEFFQANFCYWNNHFTKIIPINVAYAYMKVMVIIMIIAVVLIAYPFPNREYYKSGIKGTVVKIEREPKNWNVKIDSNWYFVRRPKKDFLKMGSRIIKNPGSWVFTIYDTVGNIVYQDSLKDITFKLIEKRNH